MVWIHSITSVIIVSLISFVGILFLAFKLDTLKKFLLLLVSFSAGALIGGAFLHLLPEAVEEFGFTLNISLFFIFGIILFFIVEKFIHWHHCHDPECKHHIKSFAYMNLVGDGVHNLIDGAVIAGAYLVSIPLGITTTIAVILHEIPQEIGDFGVLIHGGFSKARALFMNFLTALTAILGAVITLLIASKIENLTMFLIPFTAGGFIYIAAADLIPELHKETFISKSVLQLIFIILGIAIMYGLKFLH